jgi:hypothetical protein
MRRSGIAQAQMRKTAQTFSRCSTPTGARMRGLALHRGGSDVAAATSAFLTTLLTIASHARGGRVASRCIATADADTRSHRPASLRAACAQRTRSDRSAHGAVLPATPGLRQAPPTSAGVAAHAFDYDAHHHQRQKSDATFAPHPHDRATPPPCTGEGERGVRIEACASGVRGRACRDHRLPPVVHGTPHPLPPIRRLAGERRVASCAASHRRAPSRKRKPAAQGGRFGCRDVAARLSGRPPRAARRSRPASAGRSTVPARRSPARRSSLRRTRPR